jgi:hypothetical protein
MSGRLGFSVICKIKILLVKTPDLKKLKKNIGLKVSLVTSKSNQPNKILTTELKNQPSGHELANNATN